MKKLLTFLLLLCPTLLVGQTTTLNVQVTDASSQSWNNGTWQVTLIGNGPPFYQLGTTTPVPNQFQNGSMNNTGGFTVTLTQNSQISPSGTQWAFQFCSNTSSSLGCYNQTVTVTAATTLTVTPPTPVVIAGANARAYADATVVAQQGQTYFNVTSLLLRICTLSIGSSTTPVCISWATVGGGSGPGGTPRLDQVLDPNVSKAFNLGTTTLSFVNGSMDLSALTSPVKLPVIPGCLISAVGQICYDPTLGNWDVFNTSSPFITLASDNFNRANENPLGNGVWTTVGGTPLQIVSNVAESSSNIIGSSAYTGISWPNNQWASINVVTLNANGDMSINLRSNLAFTTFLQADILGSGIGNDIRITLSLAGVPTTLATVPGPINVGTVYQFGVSGTTWYLYNNGVQIGTGTNASIPASGIVIITDTPGTVSSDTTFSNFAGGSFVPSANSAIIPTLSAGGSYTTGDIVGVSNVAGQITLIDLGPVNGTVGASFVQVTTTNILNGDTICWNAAGSNWINCTPGVPPTIISATSYTVSCANDRGSYLIFTAATTTSVTIPQASTTGPCDANFFFFGRAINADAVLTPTTSTINDGSGAGASITIHAGYGTSIFSDPTAPGFYYARVNPFREGSNPLMSLEGFDVNTAGGYDWQSPNNASPGTVLNKMACDDGTGKLQTCAFASAATNNPVGVATTGINATPGTTGNTGICFIGFCKVIFDATAVGNNFAQLSTTVNGDLHDTGSTARPTNGLPYWYIFSGCTGAGCTAVIRNLAPSELNATAVGGKNVVQINGVTSQPVVNFTTSGGLTLTPTNSGNITTVAFTLSATGGYSTIQQGGVSLTQRTTLNFISNGSTGVSCVDNSGSTRTDCTVSSAVGGIAGSWQNIGTNYTVLNADNLFRDRFNQNVNAVTLPQAGTVPVSPLVALRVQAAGAQTNFTSASYTSIASNQMLLSITQGGIVNITSVTDNKGSVFTQVASNFSGTNNRIDYYYCPNLVGGAGTTLNVVFASATDGFTTIIGYELQGTTFGNAKGLAQDSFTTLNITSPVSSTNAIVLVTARSNGIGPGGYNEIDTLFNGNFAAFYYKLLSNVNSVSTTSPGGNVILGQVVLGISSAPAFTSGWSFVDENVGAPIQTITPTTSTINGLASISLVPNEACNVMSNGSNYDAMCGFTPGLLGNGNIGTSMQVGYAQLLSRGSDQGITGIINTGGNNAFYTVDASINCTIVVATGVETLTFTYTDTSSTIQTYTTSAACSTLGSASIGSIRQAFRAKSATTISYTLTHSGTQPTFDVSVSVNQLSTQ